MPAAAWLPIATFLGLGLAIATRIKLAPVAAGLLAFVVALGSGLPATLDLPTLSSTTLFLLGSVSAIGVTLVIVSAAALSMNHGWTLIALRALGSWLAAAGLLLGWTLRS